MNETPRILFVDDDGKILQALRRHFLDEPYEIHTAMSGKEGLALLETVPAEVVVSDFRMPEMNGGEFLREVSRRWPETVRLVLSGYADISAVISAINDGAIFKFVNKPWRDRELKEAVSEALEKHRSLSRTRKLADHALSMTQNLFELDRESCAQAIRRKLELEEEIKRLRLANDGFRSAVAAILIFDGEGKVVDMNPTARQLFMNIGDEACDAHEMELFAKLIRDVERVSNEGVLLQRNYPAGRDRGVGYAAALSPLCHCPDDRGVVVVIIQCEMSCV